MRIHKRSRSNKTLRLIRCMSLHDSDGFQHLFRLLPSINYLIHVLNRWLMNTNASAGSGLTTHAHLSLKVRPIDARSLVRDVRTSFVWLLCHHRPFPTADRSTKDIESSTCTSRAWSLMNCKTPNGTNFWYECGTGIESLGNVIRFWKH
jgi:hypothetical protein